MTLIKHFFLDLLEQLVVLDAVACVDSLLDLFADQKLLESPIETQPGHPLTKLLDAEQRSGEQINQFLSSGVSK